jgi:hypothetical protein
MKSMNDTSTDSPTTTTLEKKPVWKQTWARIIAGLAVVLIITGAAGGLYWTQKTPDQPVAFPHSIHVGLGAQCIYCHPGVTWGPTAGLPSTEKCWGCHQQIKKQSPELAKLTEFANSKKSIDWVPVAIQPDFVHFNHQPHIAAKVSCETCHGDVSKMNVAQPQPGQNMGWCLDCHKTMRPEKFTRLSDCSICHY